MTGPIRVTGPLLDVIGVFLHACRDDAQLPGWAITKGHEAIWDRFLLASIIGLTVNECCDVSPWAVRKLITALGFGSR